MKNKKITGLWDGLPIWREETAEETATRNNLNVDLADALIKLNESL